LIVRFLAGAVLFIGIAALPALVRAGDVRCEKIPETSTSTGPSIFQPPTRNGPTLVDVAFRIDEITGIDVRNSRFQFQAYADFSWCDPRLAFDPVDEGTEVLNYVGSEALKK
jgi:hypothetical protein